MRKGRMSSMQGSLISSKQEEWLSKDLVIDTRETWKSFISRQLNFEDPPLVPREELPEELQPHRSFYGKMACFVNGIDPNPAESRIGRRTVIANPIDRSAPTLSQVAPLRHVQSEILAERQQFGSAQVVTDFNNLNSEKTINAVGGGDNNTDEAHADKTHHILIDDDDNLFGNAPPGGSLKEGNNPDSILRKSQLSPKKSERFSLPAIGSQRKDYQEVDQDV
ncbi:hypothetical protein FGO68_gene14585 [Halteria grandinella]|uniref:Uncharacterized protein n=1 Tax=Halteria grandinella TaxID=5974 RepID=A0A8J8T0Y6_HALGN|nr:hypothetical protein FGO68_gene14585 [Halteria grandinella]